MNIEYYDRELPYITTALVLSVDSLLLDKLTQQIGLELPESSDREAVGDLLDTDLGSSWVFARHRIQNDDIGQELERLLEDLWPARRRISKVVTSLADTRAIFRTVVEMTDRRPQYELREASLQKMAFLEAAWDLKVLTVARGLQTPDQPRRGTLK